MGGGKTTLMNLLVSKYYGKVDNKNENILVINCLKNRGYNITEMKLKILSNNIDYS